MDFESLRLFVDLSDTRSFSKTAERCFMSQSAVSQRIRALEQEFGATLVERGKGRPGAQFTEAGVRLLEGARELVSRADAIKRDIAELGETVGGSLRVATVYSIGLHALTPALSHFLRDYPHVNLHLEYLRTDRIYDALLNNAIDCGIVACPRERPHIDAITLRDENMVVIAPPRHPLALLPAIPPSRLSGLPFIAFDPDIPTRGLIDTMLEEAGVKVDIVQSFDNIEMMKQVVEIGLGVSIVPEPTVAREARDETLAVRQFEGVRLTRPTGVLLRRGRPRTRALGRFLDVLTAPEPV